MEREKSLQLIESLPKVELHVHIEGSIRPETVLKLAKRNGMLLPADTVEGLKEWYTFRDFEHFVQVYVTVTKCLKTADDLLLVLTEFIDGQVAQNILHTEATFTASTLANHAGIPWSDQKVVLHKAAEYAQEKGTSIRFILDIVRGHSLEIANQTVDWVLEGYQAGYVCALGLAGVEKEGTLPYAECVKRAEDAGVPFIPHAGETMGPDSIRQCLQVGNPPRIGHGVRCLEDDEVTSILRDRGIVLETNPSSNICLGVFPSLEEYPFRKLIDAGLQVTINSDDPPMFGTTLTQELVHAHDIFGLSLDELRQIELRAAHASLLPIEAKQAIAAKIESFITA